MPSECEYFIEECISQSYNADEMKRYSINKVEHLAILDTYKLSVINRESSKKGTNAKNT